MEKRIQTDYHYGRDSLINWIYNRAISDEFPSLFKDSGMYTKHGIITPIAGKRNDPLFS